MEIPEEWQYPCICDLISGVGYRSLHRKLDPFCSIHGTPLKTWTEYYEENLKLLGSAVGDLEKQVALIEYATRKFCDDVLAREAAKERPIDAC